MKGLPGARPTVWDLGLSSVRVRCTHTASCQRAFNTNFAVWPLGFLGRPQCSGAAGCLVLPPWAASLGPQSTGIARLGALPTASL